MASLNFLFDVICRRSMAKKKTFPWIEKKAINLEFLKLDHIYLPFSGKLFYVLFLLLLSQPLIHTFIDLLLVLLILVIISKDLILILWNFRKHFIFLLFGCNKIFSNFQGYLNLILLLACLCLFWLFSLFLIFKTKYLNLSKKFTIYKKKIWTFQISI